MSRNVCSAVGCKGPIAQMDDVLECRGDCIKRFHLRCTGIPSAAVKYITNNKNVVYMCDDCLNNVSEPNEMNARYDAVLELLKEILTTVNTDKSEIIKKIDNLSNKQHTRKLDEPNISKTKTLAEIIKTGSSSSVFIKPKKTDQKSDETKTYLKEKINPAEISVNGIRKVAKGAIVVECTNKQASDKLIKKLHDENLSENYEVKETEVKKPRIKIIGLTNKDENETIVNFIKTQNDGLENAEIKVIKVFENKHRRGYNCILQVDGETFKKLMNERKIFIGWDRCTIVECVDLLRCYNCSGFQHKSVECKRAKACPRCAENHDLKDCRSEKRECTNCKFAVETYRLKLDINHEAWSSQCPTFLRRLNIQRSKTAYD